MKQHNVIENRERLFESQVIDHGDRSKERESEKETHPNVCPTVVRWFAGPVWSMAVQKLKKEKKREKKKQIETKKRKTEAAICVCLCVFVRRNCATTTVRNESKKRNRKRTPDAIVLQNVSFHSPPRADWKDVRQSDRQTDGKEWEKVEIKKIRRGR
ncbi:hypothetical protein RUM44_011578 [Polyplax serrata]|uniref:Uncharacterized protein n=1 Tax=Polyplax serrata TaxID=468196 RepID=A0ABR1AQQ9_POLSC